MSFFFDLILEALRMPRQREKDQFGGGGLFIGAQQEEVEKELKKKQQLILLMLTRFSWRGAATRVEFLENKDEEISPMDLLFGKSLNFKGPACIMI